jgi:REP element-mobilizing transposase RayT
VEQAGPQVDEDIDLSGETEATFEEVGARIVWDFDDDYEEEENSSPLLEDVPPSIPEDWVPAGMPANSRRDFLNDLLTDAPQGMMEGESEEMQVAVDFEDYYAEQEVELDATKISVSDPGMETVISEAAKDESLAETIRSRANQEAREKIKFEPVSPAMYHLTYACVLIPRLPEHHLTGDLASQLSDWVTHICLAFGWRLEHLSVRPDYFQWIVNVPPTTTPGYFMRIIRRHTSRRLYAEFPNLKERNPSGDFWAPGYLIMSGSQSTPGHLVQDFIQQTRERQGISRHN